MKKLFHYGLMALLMATLSIPFGPLPVAKADYSVSVNPAIQYQTLEGWGISLAWWANVAGSWPEPLRTEMIDAFFDADTGLGLNIARYNIGGGDCPTCNTIMPHKVIQGYQPTQGTYDWTRDANQRWVLDRAIEKGVNIVDAIAYSAPYWMTVSGTSTGAVDGGNNLSPAYYDAFVDYLTEVTKHFSNTWGVDFRTVDPFNEPSPNWWISGGGQEGMHADPAIQNTIVQKLGAALASAGLSTTITASDENSVDTAINTFNSFGAPAKNYMSQINAHTYHGTDLFGMYFTANKNGKKLWQSEWGAGSSTSGETLSNRILLDMKYMMPGAWVLWQPIWPEIMDVDYVNGSYSINPAYYVMGNYSKFIRPGFQFIAIDDANSLAAYDHSTNRLVIVTQNWETSDTSVTYDLSGFAGISGDATPYRTSSSENLAQLSPVSIVGSSFTAVAKAGSVTTYVIDGATYTPAGVVSINDNTTGTGVNQFHYSGNWLYSNNNMTGAYQNDNHWSYTKDDTYTIKFTGAQAVVYGSVSPNGGIAAISVDGGSETEVDLYALTRSDDVFLFATPTYSGGEHTLKVRVTGRKNPDSSGRIVPADRVDIVPWGGFDANDTYQIVNRNSAKALQVHGALLYNAANVTQYQVVPDALNEQWSIVGVGGGYYNIVNKNSGKCLEVYQASHDNNANVDQYTCIPGAANEEWSLVDAGGGYYKIVNRNSGKLLTVSAAATSNGANVNQYQDVSGATNQHWYVMRIK